MAAKKPRSLLLENLIALSKASIGSNTFRKLYFKIGGRKIDVLRDGDLSCAFFVSSVLKIFGLIPEIHTTVKETAKDLEKSGWRWTRRPKTGCVIVYKPKKFASGETHWHIGVYLGRGSAVSNSSKLRSPKIHKWNCRPVEKILWNKKLASK